MSFTDKQCKEIREIYHKTLDRSNLTVEEVEAAANFTLGDLIVHAGFTFIEADQFTKFIKLEARRHAAPGFNVNKKQVNESKSVIVEYTEMCRLAGLDAIAMSDDGCCGTDDAEDSYHPEENDAGGVKFEDHGTGEQAGMIKSNLQSIASKAQSLHDMIGDMDQLPEWVQEKVAVADEMIDTISDYLKYEYGKLK
jgi:hypothetical protein